MSVSGHANEEIRLSADGQNVLVPIEIFRTWQAELLELDVLRDYKVRIDQTLAELENQVLILEATKEQERRVTDAELARWITAEERARRRSRSPGLGVGIGYGSNNEIVGMIGLVWKPF